MNYLNLKLKLNLVHPFNITAQKWVITNHNNLSPTAAEPETTIKCAKELDRPEAVRMSCPAPCSLLCLSLWICCFSPCSYMYIHFAVDCCFEMLITGTLESLKHWSHKPSVCFPSKSHKEQILDNKQSQPALGWLAPSEFRLFPFL